MNTNDFSSQTESTKIANAGYALFYVLSDKLLTD